MRKRPPDEGDVHLPLEGKGGDSAGTPPADQDQPWTAGAGGTDSETLTQLHESGADRFADRRRLPDLPGLGEGQPLAGGLLPVEEEPGKPGKKKQELRPVCPESMKCLIGEKAGFRWFHVEDPKGPALDALAADFGLHELAIEDCRNHRQRGKLEEYDGHVFVIFNAIHFNTESKECWFGELDFFVGRDFLISVHEGPSRTVAAVKPKFLAEAKLAHPGKLLMALLDFMVDQYMPRLDKIEHRIEEIEERVLEQPSAAMLREIFQMRRALIDFRRVATASREVINHLLYRTEPWFRSQTPYFRNIYDHVVRTLDFCETYRDILTGVLDVYLTATANRTNDVMKILTVFTTLAIPFLIVTGIYGMNIRLPLAESPHAVHILGASTTAAAVILLLIFRKRGWI